MEMIDVRPIKNKLREESKQLRRSFSPKEKEEKDTLILQRLLALPQYKKCQKLITFVSTPIEVDTHRLIEQALKDRKQVLVPRCVPNQIKMDFCQIHSMDDLKVGTFSVLEPKESCRVVRHFPNSLCIIPGLIFDMQGYRLGYGKGYYDRFLRYYSGYRVGICYSNCLQNELPHGKYDETIHLLITDKFNKRFPFQKGK